MKKPEWVFPAAVVSAWVLVTGCGKPEREDSELFLINGKTVAEESYPGVWSIGGCTATFVSDSTMITAGHCVRPGGTVVLKNRAATRSQQVIRHPSYRGIGLHDTAVVIFPKGTAKDYVPVQTRRSATGDNVELIGYGCTLGAGRGGIKRIGTNTIKNVTRGTLILQRGARSPESGEQATLCPGDSGGPLLINGAVAGIASYWDGGAGVSSGHADLTDPVNQTFLRDTIAKQGADIVFAAENKSDHLYFAIKSDAGSEVKLMASAPEGAATVKICASAPGIFSCRADAAHAFAEKIERNGRSFFALRQGINPEPNRQYLAVAYDSNKNRIATTRISFNQR